jgi:Asp-tRNA(Asn)/Glu-tRNA(Gln) amidotransferase A subunit family amidase
VGLQVLAKRGNDEELLAFAEVLEKERLVGTTSLE